MKQTVLLEAIEYEHDTSSSGFAVTRFSPSGSNHLKAVVDAVIDSYHDVTGVAEISQDRLVELARADAKLTLAMTGGNMLGSPLVYAVEASLRMVGDRLVMMPKGARSKGFYLKGDKVLDAVEGYGKVGVLQDRIDLVRATLPELVALTKADLEAVTGKVDEDGGSPPVVLAVVGTWRMPDGDSPAAVWLISEYDADDDIADGVLLVKESDGFSEHGSVYGEQLLSGRFGKVAGFAGMSFKEALALTNGDHADGLAAVRGLVTA